MQVPHVHHHPPYHTGLDAAHPHSSPTVHSCPLHTMSLSKALGGPASCQLCSFPTRLLRAHASVPSPTPGPRPVPSPTCTPTSPPLSPLLPLSSEPPVLSECRSPPLVSPIVSELCPLPHPHRCQEQLSKNRIIIETGKLGVSATCASHTHTRYPSMFPRAIIEGRAGPQAGITCGLMSVDPQWPVQGHGRFGPNPPSQPVHSPSAVARLGLGLTRQPCGPQGIASCIAHLSVTERGFDTSVLEWGRVRLHHKHAISQGPALTAQACRSMLQHWFLKY